MSELKWLVIRELVETETASFWYDSPEMERGELNPEEIATEVFLFPAARMSEKEVDIHQHAASIAVSREGDRTSGRLSQRDPLHLPPRQAAARDGVYGSDPVHDPLRSITWDYSTEGPNDEPVVDEIMQEINGYKVAERKLVTGFDELKPDGSTACGAWIYSWHVSRGRQEPASQQTARRLSRTRLGMGVA